MAIVSYWGLLIPTLPSKWQNPAKKQKTIDGELMYIPNDDTQSMVDTFGHST